MNPMCGELKVRLADAKVVGKNVANGDYFRQEPGIERGNPQFVMSRGALTEFARCPQRWLRGYESEETKATEWGSLIDCLALQPSAFLHRFAVTPETYPSKEGPKPWNWNATFCKEWREDQSPKEVVKHETALQANNAVKCLFGCEQIRELIDGSDKQVMAVATYEDEETGLSVPLKVLIDLVPRLDTPFAKCLADLKTATCAALFVWGRAVKEHGYHMQAALYLDVYAAATGEDRPDWLHAVQESFAPWQAATWMLSSEFIEAGRMKYLDALKKYCQCLKTNVWPGYDGARYDWNGWGVVEPEPWMIA